MTGLDEFLSHPVTQSALLPGIVALVLVIAFRGRWQPLAIGGAVLVSGWLGVGVSFESLTAARKLVLVVVAASVAWPLLELICKRWPHLAREVIAVYAAIAVWWVLERLLARPAPQGGLFAWFAASALVIALIGSAMAGPRDPVRSGSASVWLGIGSGVLAILGSSAVLGVLGISIGAGAGAVLLVAVFRHRLDAPEVLSRAPELAAFASGLLCLLAIFLGDLPWWAPLPLLLVPLFARWPILENVRGGWSRAVLTLVVLAIPVLGAWSLAWVAAQ